MSAPSCTQKEWDAAEGADAALNRNPDGQVWDSGSDEGALVFLSNTEIRMLTGYSKPAFQRRWLAQNGYSFDVRADGKPVVSQAHYEAHHSLQKRGRPSAFDLAALDLLE